MLILSVLTHCGHSKHSRDLPIAFWSLTARWKRGIIPHCMNAPQSEGHTASYIARRKFLATLGAAAAWPLPGRAAAAGDAGAAGLAGPRLTVLCGFGKA